MTYATYVMFFPQLVAGPIERPQNLLHQFYERHDFDYAEVTAGLKRMAWGFFKKLVIADRLALYVNDVYAHPQNFNGLQLTLATIFFAYQIYCDFSGYSDIAIGAARVLGFKLMENFNKPYQALTSLSSGGVGTFRFRPGSAITSTFRWAAAGSANDATLLVLSLHLVSVVFGTGRIGPTSSGVYSMRYI